MGLNVRSTDARFADSLRWHLEPFRRRANEADAIPIRVYVREEDQELDPPPYAYARGQELVQQNTSIEHVFRFALWDLHYQVSQNVRAFLALHAGAVSTRDAAMLLPAPADTGKSTLVGALLERGFDYLSDEAGALDPITERAYPFPKRLALDDASVALFPGLADRLEDRTAVPLHASARYVRPEDLGSPVGRPEPVRWTVFVSADREGSPHLKRLPKAEAVERMAANCFNLFRYGERGVVLLSRIAAGSEVYLLEGGRASERADLLAERFLRG